MTPKVYVFCNGTFDRDLVMVAVCENGVYLGSHICSNLSFARHDLTGTPKRKEAIEAVYPDGYEVVVLEKGEFPPDEVFELNRKLGEESNEE